MTDAERLLMLQLRAHISHESAQLISLMEI